MSVFTVIKVDDFSSSFGHRSNVGVFSTSEKAQAFISSSVVEMFDSGNLCGISFYVEENSVE
jgi:hypothetical protein